MSIITRRLSIVVLVAMLIGLLPANSALAKSGGGFKFYGTVESLPAGWIGTWVVSGRAVQVTPGTQIKQKYGAPAVGAYVEVRGWLQPDNSVSATKVEVKSGSGGGSGISFKFYGTVSSLPSAPGWIGTWIVGGRNVQVTASTWIKQRYGAPAAGAYVEVKGWLQADGSVNATRIEVKSSPGGGYGGGVGGGYVKFYGIVENLPTTPGWAGLWVVSGRTVNVTASTWIKQKYGAPVLGGRVEVKGIQQPDGSINASQVETRR